MKILVTGANGQLGSSIKKLEHEYPAFQMVYTDVEELDICKTAEIDSFFNSHKPDVVINCAAYTAVDKAEEETDKALLLNSTAPKLLANACAASGALFVHISTDYVFDGKNHRPWSESDPPNPQSSYGISKLKGEENIRDTGCNALIIRTSWLFSEFGGNFVKTILRLGSEKQELNVVYDQVGTPTYAGDLAKAILDIISGKIIIKGYNIYHYANEGVTSWYDFAVEIMELTGTKCRIYPVTTAEYPLPAARPQYSIMNKQKIKTGFGIVIPHWKDGLRNCLKRLA